MPGSNRQGLANNRSWFLLSGCLWMLEFLHVCHDVSSITRHLGYLCLCHSTDYIHSNHWLPVIPVTRLSCLGHFLPHWCNSSGLLWWFRRSWIHWQCRRPRFDPWVRSSPEEGHGNPLQHSCLENSMDRGARQGTTERLTHTCTHTHTDTHVCLNSGSLASKSPLWYQSYIWKSMKSFKGKMKDLQCLYLLLIQMWNWSYKL